MNTSHFVLIHGAWHGAWCWFKLAARLRAAGHAVSCPDLPGHGVDRTPIADVTLNAYVERVASVLDAAPAPVVLVGHSMGGAVVSQTAEARPERIRASVYLAAFAPAHGQSVFQVARADPDDRMGARMVMSADRRSITLRPETLREGLYADCSDEDVALAQLLLVPQASAPLAAPLALTDARYGRVPRHYIECTQDLAVSPRAQRTMAGRQGCASVHALDTSHSPFLSAPDRLAELLKQF
jgi:pimeloyl-ACP methyl ester carboxylesterase